MHARHPAVARADIDGDGHLRRQLEVDVQIGIGTAEKIDVHVVPTAKLDNQPIAFATLGDGEILQQLLVGCTGAAIEVAHSGAITTSDMQVVTVDLKLNLPHAGQVQPHRTGGLVFAFVVRVGG